MACIWRYVLALAVAAFMICAFPHVSQGSNEYCESGEPTWHDVEHKLRFSSDADAKFEVGRDGVSVQRGSLIFDVMNSTTIKLPLSTVETKSHSLIFVRSQDGCEHVLVLLGSAPVRVGPHRAVLNSGEEAVVTDHEPTYKDLAGQDDIGRRRFRMTALPDNRTLAVSEFSLIQALEREPLIHNLLNCNDGRDRALKMQLIKMAAVLNIVTARHGQYTTGLR